MNLDLGAHTSGIQRISVINETKDVYEEIEKYIINPDHWISLTRTIVSIILIIIISVVAAKFSKKIIGHMIVERRRNPLRFDPRRTTTIGKLIGNVATSTINFIAILLILSQLGIDLRPLLAGAGVIGLAIGFGAQSLVKDVITGFFIIFEDQFAVGDVVQTGTFKGTVEEIGLRVTRIKSYTGEVYIIPNGLIQQVTNFSVNNSIAVVDFSIPNDKDIDGVIEVMKAVAVQIFEGDENLITLPEVLGVQTLNNADSVLRITAECKANTQAHVTRILNAEVKKALSQYYSRTKKAE